MFPNCWNEKQKYKSTRKVDFSSDTRRRMLLKSKSCTVIWWRHSSLSNSSNSLQINKQSIVDVFLDDKAKAAKKNLKEKKVTWALNYFDWATYGQVPDLVRENCSSGLALRVWPSRSSGQIPVAIVWASVIIIECFAICTGWLAVSLAVVADFQPTDGLLLLCCWLWCVMTDPEWQSHHTIIIDLRYVLTIVRVTIKYTITCVCLDFCRRIRTR